VVSGKQVFQYADDDLEAHTVAFSPTASLLAVGFRNRWRATVGVHDPVRPVAIIIWNVKTGKEYRRLVYNENSARLNNIRKITFSPDGKTLAAGTSGLLTLWDVESGKKLFGTHDLRHEWFEDLVFAPNGRVLACVTSKSSSDPGKAAPKETLIELWDMGKQIKKRSRGLPVPNNRVALAFSPDSQFLAAACWNDQKPGQLSPNKVRVFNVMTATLERTFNAHTAGVFCVSYSRDGQRLFTGGWDLKKPGAWQGEACWKAWEVPTGRLVQTAKAHALPIICLAGSPNGRQLATGAQDGTVRLWTIAENLPKKN
jgi:WD40 repeat protein